MILQILKFILICLEVLLVFNLLIIVHELGHFLAARWRGLVVEKFGIWFGKPIWKKTVNGVEYSLGCIPAGGFVALPQLAPMDIIEGEVDVDRATLPKASVKDKIIVALAGPVFSLGLAFIFACLVWMVGRPVAEAELTTTVGYVEEGGPAAKAGIQPGDRILSVDGHPVVQFAGMRNVQRSITWNVARSETPIIPVVFERDGKEQTVQVEPIIEPRKGWGRRNLRQIGIAPPLSLLIAQVSKESPAQKAGMQSGDIILSVNGQKLWNPYEFMQFVKDHPTQPMTLAIQRGDEPLNVTLTPELIQVKEDTDGPKPRIGVIWSPEGKTVLVYPDPFRQIADSATTMWATISAVASPKSSIKPQHLSGPVGIMNVYIYLFQRDDWWRQVLWFSVILNVNLALLNMLPIPVLDGGHIVLAIIEGIRRRPINIRVLEVVQSACALLVIGFIIYVSFFDVLDFSWKR